MARDTGTPATDPSGLPLSGAENSRIEAAAPRSDGIAWEADLPLGTFSSPRLIETAAGPEMLMAFGNEFAVAGGAVAINVATGRPRWRVDSEHELFAMPMPLTPRPGGEQPWVFAGRDGQLQAIDVASGQELWRFGPAGQDGRSQGIYNFYTGREFGDADADGVPDYLVTNGGDSKSFRYESRPPGHLMVLSGVDGSEIHRLVLPEGRETYCSPLLWSRMGEQWVVFGTGGETFPGSLWAVPADSVRAGTLAGIRSLLTSADLKGMIAPPSFADLDNDGVLDLIVTPFDGRLVVLSGSSLTPLWSFDSPHQEETQSSPAVGDFDGDGDLDIVAVEQRGVFPQWNASAIRAFDGASGKLIWDHVIYVELVPASPLAIDVDADGRDEVLFTQSDPGLFRGKPSVSRMQVVHIEEDRIDTVAAADGLNSGAGWVGDADGDGLLEWFVPLRKLGDFGSLVRVNLAGPVPARIAWGGYLGTKHDGTY